MSRAKKIQGKKSIGTLTTSSQGGDEQWGDRRRRRVETTERGEIWEQLRVELNGADSKGC